MFTEEELNSALKKKLAEIDHKLAVHSARESFWEFYKLMLGKEVPDFSETAFHKRICDNLQDLYEGKITKLAIFIPPQSGKLLSDKTIVPTPNGFVKHGNLKAGDYVLGRDGKPVKVLAVSSKDYADYEIEFNDGEKIISHGKHEWVCFYGSKELTVETSELFKFPDVWEFDANIFSKNSKRRSIKSVTKCNPEIGNCIQVEGGVYLVGKTYIPTHNSTISSIYYPAWVFGKNRNEMIAVTSYSATMASSFNRKTQLVIDNHLYNEIFPETFLNESNVRTVADGSKERNSDKFEIIRGSGSYKSVGVGGGLTGHTVTLGIIDDPFKDRADANSVVMRNRVWDWYVDVFQSRLQNKSRILMLFTRWHEDDLAGRAIEREGGWTVIKLPAIKEDDNDLLDNRKVGEALWPEKHSLESILAQKERSASSFASLYQQRPAPLEGGMIKGNWFEIVDMPAGRFDKKIVIDPAYTEDGDNDPTGILTYFGYQNDLYIYNWETVRFQTPDLIRHIKMLIEMNQLGNGGGVRIEPKANGLPLIHELQRSSPYRNISAFSFTKGNPLSKITGSQSKETRADGITEILSHNRVKLVRGGWNDNFLTEVKQFPNARHDEAVDCLVMAVADEFMSKKTSGIRIRN